MNLKIKGKIGVMDHCQTLPLDFLIDRPNLKLNTVFQGLPLTVYYPYVKLPESVYFINAIFQKLCYKSLDHYDGFLSL